MKTPMQELIEWMETVSKSERPPSVDETFYRNYTQALSIMAIKIRQEYLYKEKQQMCAFANDYADQVMAGMMKRAEEYYNETFGELKP